MFFTNYKGFLTPYSYFKKQWSFSPDQENYNFRKGKDFIELRSIFNQSLISVFVKIGDYLVEESSKIIKKSFQTEKLNFRAFF